MNSIPQKSPVQIWKDSICSKITLLKKRRFSFPDFNTKITTIGLTSSNGFDSICKKIQDISESLSTINTILSAIDLYATECLTWHSAFYNKRLTFYSASNIDLQKLDKALSIGKKYRPLDSLSGLNEEPISIGENDLSSDLKIFYLCSKRSYFTKEHIKGSDIDHSILDEYTSLISMIQVLRHDLVATDFIAIDKKNNLLIIGIDLVNVFPESQTNKAEYHLFNLVTKTISHSSLIKKNFRNSVTLMETEALGLVLGHSFSSTGGVFHYSGKTSALRDIRLDPFFMNGSSVQNLDFFWIRKAYLYNSAHYVLSLGLSQRDYNKPTLIPVSHVIMDQVTDPSTFFSCLNKIIEHS